MSARTCGPVTTWCWRCSPPCTPRSRAFVRSASALDAVRLLIEMLADDAAVRAAGPTPLARALVACAAGPHAVGRAGRGRPEHRRAGAPPGRPAATACRSRSRRYLAAAAVLIVPTIALAVPWLTELHRLFIA